MAFEWKLREEATNFSWYEALREITSFFTSGHSVNGGENKWEKALSSPSEGHTLLRQTLMGPESEICNVPSEKFTYYKAKCIAVIPDYAY